jgi:hypothetical protein
MDTEDTGGRRVELAVRSLAPSGGQRHQDAIVERLDNLRRQGVIDDYDVSVWGRRVGLTTAGANTTVGREIVNRVERFAEWAASAGFSIDSFFETCEICSELAEEEYTALVLPSITLAEYVDDEVDWVSPCADGERVYSVQDRLDDLEENVARARTGLDRSSLSIGVEE